MRNEDQRIFINNLGQIPHKCHLGELIYWPQLYVNCVYGCCRVCRQRRPRDEIQTSSLLRKWSLAAVTRWSSSLRIAPIIVLLPSTQIMFTINYKCIASALNFAYGQTPQGREGENRWSLKECRRRRRIIKIIIHDHHPFNLLFIRDHLRTYLLI